MLVRSTTNVKRARNVGLLCAVHLEAWIPQSTAKMSSSAVRAVDEESSARSSSEVKGEVIPLRHQIECGGGRTDTPDGAHSTEEMQLNGRPDAPGAMSTTGAAAKIRGWRVEYHDFQVQVADTDTGKLGRGTWQATCTDGVT